MQITFHVYGRISNCNITGVFMTKSIFPRSTIFVLTDYFNDIFICNQVFLLDNINLNLK